MNLASLPQRALNRMGLDWRLGAVNPTVELYFAGPLSNLIAAGGGPSWKRPIQQLGPHLFVCGSSAVLVRYAQKAELKFLGRRGLSKVYYILDDLMSGFEADTSLPDAYRRRLASFATNRLPAILDLATTLIVPNVTVASGLDRYPIEILEPAAIRVCDDFSHFEQANQSQLKVLLSGSRSHAADMEMIAPGVLRAIKRNPRLQFTSFLGDLMPRCLKGHASVRNHHQLPWPMFRHLMQKKRFHVAAAPYRDTPFNGARSISKILDHGAFGAAGLYSDRAPHNRYVNHRETGYLMSDDHYDWSEAILELAGRPRHALNLASRGAALARQLGDRKRVRRFWIEKLAIEAAV